MRKKPQPVRIYVSKELQGLQATWSVTFIDGYGRAVCFNHFQTNQQACDYLDFRYEMEPSIFAYARVLHSYGPCSYCGVNANADK